MFKKISLFVLFLLLSANVYAGMTDEDTFGGQNSDYTYRMECNVNGNVVPGKDSSTSFGTTDKRWSDGYFDAIHTTDQKSIHFSPAEMTLNTSAPLTASSTPVLANNNAMTSIVWADAEVTPIRIQFRIPADYTDGGNFRVLASNGSLTSSGGNFIGWGIYENVAGTTWDAVRYNGALDKEVLGDTTPDEVTLMSSTEAATFAAGRWVTLEIWRDNVNADGARTANMEVYGIDFIYDA